MLRQVEEDTALQLAVFDLDGTLTTERSPFAYVSRALGRAEDADEVTARYRRGEIDYEEWGKEATAIWRGTPEPVLCDIVAQITYRSGAEAFIRQLRHAGVIVAIISVAFGQHVLPRAAELGISEVCCNQLHVEDGRLTGEFSHVVNGSNKDELVRSLQEKYGVTADQTLVAGDSEGDIPMFSLARLSIAVDPESSNVLSAAQARLPCDDWNRAVELIDRIHPGWVRPASMIRLSTDVFSSP